MQSGLAAYVRGTVDGSGYVGLAVAGNATGKTGRSCRSAIDARTTRHPGYDMSQTRRAMIECIFGWGKQHGTMRKT
jgi:hypothetical protein